MFSYYINSNNSFP